MPVLMHISDMHFGPHFVPEIAEDLLRSVAEIQPDCILATGDFTQRAKPAEFAAARDYLDRMSAVPVVCVPGNHDIPLYRVLERCLNPYRHYLENLADELDRVVSLPGMVIAAINSTAPLRAISNGRIWDWQLDLCERAFRDAPEGDLRVVAAHHHFLPAPDYARDIAMPGAKRALDRLIAQRVDLILGGHLHRAYVGNSLDVYRGADPEHGIIIVQCGTSTSRRGRGREREKNSFNVIETGGDRFSVTHYIHFEIAGGFAPASRHTFPRPGQLVLKEVAGGAG